MLNWTLIIGVVVVLIVLALMFKFKEIRHKIGLVVAILVFLFLLASAIHLYNNSNTLDLTTFDGVVSAGKLYFNWIGSITANVIKISGYVINQNWTINAQTNQSSHKIK